MLKTMDELTKNIDVRIRQTLFSAVSFFYTGKNKYAISKLKLICDRMVITIQYWPILLNYDKW